LDVWEVGLRELCGCSKCSAGTAAEHLHRCLVPQPLFREQSSEKELKLKAFPLDSLQRWELLLQGTSTPGARRRAAQPVASAAVPG